MISACSEGSVRLEIQLTVVVVMTDLLDHAKSYFAYSFVRCPGQNAGAI
jgi:hypothetical protein